MADSGRSNPSPSAPPAPAVRLRRAQPSDCDQVWQLNNEAGARAASRVVQPIPLADHRRWFAARLVDPDTELAIVEVCGGRAVGVVRVERRAGAAELSIAIDPAERGRGLGSAAVRVAAATAAARWPGIQLEAWIAEDNPASIRCFEAAGFAMVRRDPSGARAFRLYRNVRQEREP